jgi:hypothetical protein
MVQKVNDRDINQMKSFSAKYLQQKSNYFSFKCKKFME